MDDGKDNENNDNDDKMKFKEKKIIQPSLYYSSEVCTFSEFSDKKKQQIWWKIKTKNALR